MAVDILGKLNKAFVSNEGLMDAADLQVDNAGLVGVLSGIVDGQTALNRIDGTGVGAELFLFTGAYSATVSNINEWFGGKQIVRMRCTGPATATTGALNFDLPGTSALNTAFDQLQTLGIAERIEFIIEYTGTVNNFINIRPRATPSPQIMGTTSIVVRSGVAATLEVTRSSGTISSYIFTSIRQVAQAGTGVFDALKLQNPTNVVWDASENGTLPTTGVVKGNAYKVINAPADGSGRFGEVMYTDDWVVWEGETFTGWATEPRQWFVISAHDVRRITALEQDFLTDVEITDPSDRNAVTRGSAYADTAGEIRLKIYSLRTNYNASDLNVNGDIDEYTNASAITGFMAIRLTGTQSQLVDVLPTLYLYSESSDGTFTRLANMSSDFSFEGDFSGESDYLAFNTISYSVGDTLRLYIGSVVDRYNNPNLDIDESNLTRSVQLKLNRADHASIEEVARINSNEAKIDALYPLTADVRVLSGLADVYDPEETVTSVTEATGNSSFIDYRGDATRYESTGITYDSTGTNVVRYTGLGDDDHRVFGFNVSGPSNQVLMWVFDGTERIPYIDITSGGNIRVNNYTPARDVDERRNPGGFTSPIPGIGTQPLGELITDTGTGPTTLIPGNTTSERRYPIPDFPATSTQRSRSVNFQLIANTTDGRQDIFVTKNFILPTENTSASEDFDTHTLTFLNGTTATLVVGVLPFVLNNQLYIDLRIVSSTPNIANVVINFARLYRAYTITVAEPRVDTYITLTSGGGTHVFSGQNEFMFSFRPGSTAGEAAIESVGLTDSTGLITLFDPISAHAQSSEFSTVEIPDQTAFSGFEFRSFLPDHNVNRQNLEDLLANFEDRWVYGLARFNSVTEHAFTSEIDFDSGLVLTSPDGTRYAVGVSNDGTLTTVAK